MTTDGELKLCDFGSATTETYAPDVSWSAQQRDMLEDQVSVVLQWNCERSRCLSRIFFENKFILIAVAKYNDPNV